MDLWQQKGIYFINCLRNCVDVLRFGFDLKVGKHETGESFMNEGRKKRETSG